MGSTDIDEDAIIEMIRDGASLTELARGFGKSRAWLSTWLNSTPERSARAKDARQESAAAFEDLALIGIQEAADAFELAKAKEAAHHYRWSAAVRHRSVYGDKVTNEHTGPNGGAIQIDEGTRAARVAQLMAVAAGRRDAEAAKVAEDFGDDEQA